MIDEDLIYMFLTIIGILFVSFILISSIIAYGVNWQSRVNCRLLEKNGNDVKLESYKILFFNVKDCYVRTGETYVPYDRFIGVGD